jgi:hypothetical protein
LADTGCLQRLHKRTHRCTHYVWRNADLYDDDAFTRRLGRAEISRIVDHHVWLRWPDRTWGLLSQPYPSRLPFDPDVLTAGKLRVIDLGRAPYSAETVAQVLIGTDWPQVLKVYLDDDEP